MAREIQLKDGRKGTIRRAERTDFDGIVETWLAMAEDGRGMVGAPEEHTMERAEKSIGSYIDGKRSGDKGACFVCVVDGRIAGQADVRKLDSARVRHVAILGIGIHPEFQALGLGRALMESVIDWSRDTGVIRLDLNVRCDNDRAIGLYESLGFVREGVRERFIRLDDGSFIGDATMVRFFDC